MPSLDSGSLRGFLPARFLVLLVLAIGATSTAPATATAQVLTEERILTSSDFRPGLLVQPSWTPGGERLTHLVPAENGGSDLVARDVRTGETEVLVRAEELVPEGERERIAIEGYQVSPDGKRLLIFTRTEFVWRERTRGVYYVLDHGTGELLPLSTRFGWQQFAKFSPDGGRVGFVRENDLFVVDLESGEEWRLMDTGSETIVNGTFDWARGGAGPAGRLAVEPRQRAHRLLEPGPEPRAVLHLRPGLRRAVSGPGGGPLSQGGKSERARPDRGRGAGRWTAPLDRHGRQPGRLPGPDGMGAGCRRRGTRRADGPAPESSPEPSRRPDGRCGDRPQPRGDVRLQRHLGGRGWPLHVDRRRGAVPVELGAGRLPTPLPPRALGRARPAAHPWSLGDLRAGGRGQGRGTALLHRKGGGPPRGAPLPRATGRWRGGGHHPGGGHLRGRDEPVRDPFRRRPLPGPASRPRSRSGMPTTHAWTSCTRTGTWRGVSTPPAFGIPSSSASRPTTEPSCTAGRSGRRTSIRTGAIPC